MAAIGNDQMTNHLALKRCHAHYKTLTKTLILLDNFRFGFNNFVNLSTTFFY